MVEVYIDIVSVIEVFRANLVKNCLGPKSALIILCLRCYGFTMALKTYVAPPIRTDATACQRKLRRHEKKKQNSFTKHSFWKTVTEN